MRNTAVNLILNGNSIVTVFLIGNFGVTIMTKTEYVTLINLNTQDYCFTQININKLSLFG